MTDPKPPTKSLRMTVGDVIITVDMPAGAEPSGPALRVVDSDEPSEDDPPPTAEQMRGLLADRIELIGDRNACRRTLAQIHSLVTRPGEPLAGVPVWADSPADVLVAVQELIDRTERAKPPEHQAAQLAGCRRVLGQIHRLVTQPGVSLADAPAWTKAPTGVLVAVREALDRAEAEAARDRRVAGPERRADRARLNLLGVLAELLGVELPVEVELHAVAWERIQAAIKIHGDRNARLALLDLLDSLLGIKLPRHLADHGDAVEAVLRAFDARDNADTSGVWANVLDVLDECLDIELPRNDPSAAAEMLRRRLIRAPRVTPELTPSTIARLVALAHDVADGDEAPEALQAQARRVLNPSKPN